MLLGRRTYEGFAAAWPQYEGELADKYNRYTLFTGDRSVAKIRLYERCGCREVRREALGRE